MGMMLAMIGDALAGGFGVAAAILLIGGAVMLRWQRNRLQYALLQAALEKGGPPFPAGAPLWLTSLRQGVMILVLGVGLAVCGAAAYQVASHVAMPANTVSADLPSKISQDDDGPPPPPPAPRESPNEHEALPGHHRPPPPRPDPATERWHRAQDQMAVAEIAVGGGFILVLLGIVRIVFAFAERKYPGGAGAVP